MKREEGEGQVGAEVVYIFGTDVTCTPTAVGASLTTCFDRARCNFQYAQSVTKGKQGSGSDPVN